MEANVKGSWSSKLQDKPKKKTLCTYTTNDKTAPFMVLKKPATPVTILKARNEMGGAFSTNEGEEERV
jgi:hypothetical protein